MRWSTRARLAALSSLPKAWQPPASFHYYRWRSQLEREMPLICRALGPGTCAIDVGANEGVYTHAFARTGADVEAFEPHPHCADVLRSYERAHPNVRAHQVALGASNGWAKLRVPMREGRAITSHGRLEPAGSDGSGVRVEVRTLDSFAFARVDAIKIDVEGRELDVIEGARGTIAAHRPVLLVEIEQRHLVVPIQDVFATLATLGYTGMFLDASARERPLGDFEPDRDQRLENADRAGAFYVNNFLFAPPDTGGGGAAGRTQTHG